MKRIVQFFVQILIVPISGALAPQPKSFESFKAMLPTMPMPEDQDNMSEDCLFLNIYTPTVTPDRPMPVMVFLHGGGFFIGEFVCVNILTFTVDSLTSVFFNHGGIF